MYQVIIIVHVLLGLSVIGFVLIQQGKGADAGAAFGSASSGSVFGAQGASSFLSRTTAILAAAFFSTSLGLAVLVGHQEGDVDLMNTTEVEEVFADLPLINGGESATELESIPVIANDELGSVTDEASNLADSVKKEVQSVIETTKDKTITTIENTEAVISDAP